MSRCFPFPPPGYERKARADDLDLLKKEKHREKKRKKEKKEREKREDKEKREKDRSEGKHRDKKDKKERHKAKKKDKEDREREREKNGAADERRLSGQADGNDKDKNSDKDRLSWHSGGPSGEKTIQDAGKDKNKNRTLYDKGGAAQLASYSAEKITQKNQNSHVVENSNDSKFVQELGKRVRDGAGLGSQLVEKFTGVDQKRDGGMAEAAIAETGSLLDSKEKIQQRKGDDQKSVELNDERKFSGNSVLLNTGGSIQTVSRPVEKFVDRKKEVKEKNKEKEGDSKGWDKRGIVATHQIKSQGKDKDRDREKKKEDKVKKSDGRKNGPEKIRESKKDNADAIPTPNIIAQPLENTNKVSLTGVNLKKRKDLEANGFLHGNESKLHKLPRPTSTSHHLTENGRVLDPSQTPSKFLSDGWDSPDALKAESKKNKVNGILDTRPDPFSKIHPLPEKSLEDLLAEAAARSPHPDSKYLDELMAVPKLEELSELGRDEDWLFASRRQKPKKGEGGSSKAEEETSRIWDKAVYLDSADIVALPYVVPF